MLRLGFFLVLCVGYSVNSSAETAPMTPRFGNEPVLAVASISSYAAVASDLEQLAGRAGVPRLRTMLEQHLAALTSGVGVGALRLDEPWGVIVYGRKPHILGFLPTTHPRTVIDGIANIAEVPPAQREDGIVELRFNNTSLCFTSTDRYLFVSPDPSSLKTLPKNPASFLADLPRRFDFAAQVYWHNVPLAYRTFISNQLVTPLQQLSQDADESAKDFNVRRAASLKQVRLLGPAIDSIDTIVAGWNLHSDASVVFDLNVNALPDSPLTHLSALSGEDSRFGGFQLPEASTRFRTTLNGSPEMADFITSMMRQRLNLLGGDESEKAQIKSRVRNSLLKRFNQTLHTSGLDLVASGNLADGKLELVGALALDDTKDTEALLQKLIAMDTSGKTTWQQATIGDARCHIFDTTALTDEPDSSHGIFGFGSSAFYFAFGANAETRLDRALQGSSGRSLSPRRLAEFSVTASAALERLQDRNAMFGNIASLLRELPGENRIVTSIDGTEAGFRVRLELQRNVLGSLTRLTTHEGNLSLRPE